MEKPIIDERNLTLQKWLELISPHPNDRDYQIVDYQFPTDALRDEYLASVHARSDFEVKNLLRKFLMQSGRLGIDKFTLQYWLAKPKVLERAVEQTEFAKRLLNPERFSWEGNTWILDLLPSFPDEARSALSAYITAHAQFLPDGRFTGMFDALSVIRARYFEYPHLRDAVMDLRPRDFEFLVAALFAHMGFSATVTKSTRDGGFDVFGIIKEHGSKQKVVVQCKRRSDRVGVAPIRELCGVLESRRVNKGFFVSCGSYTAPAHAFARENRIELIGWEELNQLLNRHLGQDWVQRMEFHITNQKSKVAKSERVANGIEPPN